MDSSLSKSTELPADVAVLLRRLRRSIRLYVWAEGLASLAIVLGLSFWIGLAVDWFFEPSPAIRVLAWSLVVVLCMTVLYRRIVQRLRVPLTNNSMALLIERQFTVFHDSLLTAVELARPDPLGLASPAMLRRTAADARSQIGGVRLARIFNFRPLGMRWAGAGILIVSVVLFGLLGRDAFGFWLRRIGLTETLWPRRVALVVDGFPATPEGPRVERVAREDTFELTVRALLEGTHRAPERVEIRYRMKGGQRGRDTMTQIGSALPGRDRGQRYRYSFKNIASDLVFDVIGGDDRIDDLVLRVVDRPNLVGMRVRCDYPEYMASPSETLDVTGTMLIPEGTRLRFLAQATKRLAEAHWFTGDRALDQIDRYPEEEAGREVSFQLPPLSNDMALRIALTDQDGIRTREPIRIGVTMASDPPPEVAVRLQGIGMAVTPDARIPFTGTITDPLYGIERCWFEWRAGGGASQSIPFTAEVAGRQEIRVAEALDARQLDPESNERVLQLEPGTQLVIRVLASDGYDLTDTPHAGSSPPFTLDIVTPNQLRALLEQRELALRQRLETLIEKTGDTRRLLERIDFSTPGTETMPDPGTPAGRERVPAPEEPAPEEPAPEEPARESRRLRLIAARQNMAQVAQEILGIAESFDQIQAELIHNRVDTEEMLDRIRNGIAEPLREIAGTRIPELQAQFDVVQWTMDQHPDGRRELEVGLVLTDRILVAMREVLAKMIELENYHEVLDLLRRMIEDQETLHQKTKSRQKEQLRGLLD